MTVFAEELHRVRSKRGYTQERLAAELNVARQTISHWENNRALPDIDTIKQLSLLLDHNFLAIEGLSEEISAGSAADAPAKAPAAEAQRGDRVITLRFRLRTLVIAACVLIVCALAAGLLAWTLTKDSAEEAPEVTYPRFSYDWYTAPQSPVAGQAFLQITPAEEPTHAMRSEDDPEGPGYWMYCLNVKSTNDIGFTIEKVWLHHFTPQLDGGIPMIYGANEFIELYGGNYLVSGAGIEWWGGFQVQSLVGVGLAIEGTDDNGNRLIFHGYVSLDPRIIE